MKPEKPIRRVFNFFRTLPATICLITVTGFLVASCGKEEEKVTEEVVRPVKIMTITSGADVLERKYPGKIRATQQVDLAFKVSGPLIELPVEEGKAVKEGELIARIDPRDFETSLKGIKSSLSEANANLKAMKRGARPEDIKLLESEIDAAEAKYLAAEAQYKRYKQLWEKRHVSKADFDRYERNWDVTKAKLEMAKQNLEKGKKGARKEDIEAMQSKIRGLEAQRKGAQDALDDTYLKTPFSGVIAKKYVDNFQDVRAKQAVVSLQDISRVDILVDVPESLM
ncbi:MAG: biotin/lipoyl-binding protein, partial [Deltaproteobacteria bacterium]|nr:biotin/lipoyl-binding protein [Deltaproteobacteria bacterium]